MLALGGEHDRPAILIGLQLVKGIGKIIQKQWINEVIRRTPHSYCRDMAIMAPLNGNICGNDRTHPSFPRPGSDWSLARLRRQQTTARTSLRSVRFVCGTAAHGTECAAGELVPLAAAPFIWPAFGAVIAGLPAPESTGHPGGPSSG